MADEELLASLRAAPITNTTMRQVRDTLFAEVDRLREENRRLVEELETAKGLAVYWKSNSDAHYRALQTIEAASLSVADKLGLAFPHGSAVEDELRAAIEGSK